MKLSIDLPTLADRGRCAKPKHQIVPRVVAKEEKRKSKDEQGKAFRDAVWKRDESRCRATGEPLVRQGTTDSKRLGEVDHSIPRSLAPDRIYDVTNGLLLSKHLNRLRKVACPEAPEFRMFDYTGPDDRSKPQVFVWRDKAGKVIRRTKG
jgi:5-methylcytosine-specific restriction endonuclease McrA